MGKHSAPKKTDRRLAVKYNRDTSGDAKREALVRSMTKINPNSDLSRGKGKTS